MIRGQNQLLVGLDKLTIFDVQIDSVNILNVGEMHRARQWYHNIAHSVQK